MAFDKNQNEPALPVNSSQKRQSQNHLPRYYRTEANTKFLTSTVDQLIQPGVVEKINSYAGRKTAKAYRQNDNYIGDISQSRENYQLEPASVIADDLGNITFYKDYNDYINQLNNMNKGEQDHSIVNSQEFYAWSPCIDWDKFVNFRDYYWLPNGPQSVPVFGNTIEVESTIKITISDNVDNYTYFFSTYGTVNNPTITLYRGQIYQFQVDTPNLPITLKTQRTLDEEFNLDSDSISLFDEVNFENLESGTITFRLGNDIPDTIYYVSKNDINASGTIIVKDIEEATFINVEEEIIGKRYYKTANGFDLSNGMKVYFTGEVEPVKYSQENYYVEGVGDSIRLIPESKLNVPTAFTDDVFVDFDSEGFDTLPFSKAIGYPRKKDYLVINRSSLDGNLWSRYNRWFHKTVIENSAAINNQPVTLDQGSRAKRPVIEFEQGLKLHNFGTYAKQDVDLVDDYTTDVFSTIEGKQGYNIDGIDVADGMRILFIADTDILVKNRIFQVEYINFSSGADTNKQIHLKEVADTQPLENEVVLAQQGNRYKGRQLFFNGTIWNLTQEKTDVNQAPLFDIFDDNGNSYGNIEVYPGNNFTGTKVFSYKEDSGLIDNELGFSISYRNIENVGDILFNYNLLFDSMSYTLDNEIFLKTTDVGFLRKYLDRVDYQNLNGWTIAESESSQPVIRQYVFDNTQTSFEIDVYETSALLDDLWVRIYLNNRLQFEDIDYVFRTNIQNNKEIVFLKDLSIGDILVVKTKSSAIKNENGYYEIPINLERNPLNESLVDFTLGEVNDHVSTIVESLDDFIGEYPGTSNLRDIGPISKFGKRFVQHSSPINLSLYHTVDKDANAANAIRFAKNEYSKFKRLFLTIATELGYDGTTKDYVDEILKIFVRDKVSTMPFFFSDMVPLGASKKNSYVVKDPDNIFFALSKVFLMTDQTRSAVQVYKNGIQLIHQRDYTFSNAGFCLITAEKELDDLIEIYEYENTNGCYVPPTPTKLGLYPAYEPEFLIDDTYQPSVDEYKTTNGSRTRFSITNIHRIVPDHLIEVLIEGAIQTDNYNIDTDGTDKFVVFDNPIEAGDIVTIKYPKVVIQGHDGSIFLAYNDYRDDLLLELEKRIYNNLKVAYDINLFNIHEFVGGEYRNTGLTRQEINKPMLRDFLEWSTYVESDYTLHNFFERTNRFTFNYKDSNSPNGNTLPGFWRQIYKEAYDTDRPHTHPWEMLGFSIKPNWWETVYGPLPYTSDNLILWRDLEQGIIREPGKKIVFKNNYKRPGLINYVPVNSEGKLLPPIDSGYVRNFSSQSIDDSFVFGDGAPVESAWRKSSEFPFSLITSLIINKPSKVFATAFDRIRQVRNLVGQIVYSPTNKRIKLDDIIFPNNSVTESRQENIGQIYTAGIVNYVANYMASDVLKSYSTYKENLQNLRNQLGFKIGGFTDQEKFRLLLDSRTPLNQGNVFIPDENYKIFLNTSSPVETITYSGVIIEKRSDGFVIKGYDKDTASFKYHKAIATQNDPSINIGGISEPFLVWNSNKQYIVGSNVEYQGSYYRVKQSHTSSSTFDGNNFVKLPNLPTVGGRNAFIRKQFIDAVEEELSYGSLLTEVQDVIDFLLGYANWLETKGFVFDYFDGNEGVVLNWRHSINEFLFWTTQNWSEGSVITLSPSAVQLKFNSQYSVVDNIFDSFYGYTLLKSDGQKLVEEFTTLGRQPNEFVIRPKNTADGIFSVKLPLVQTEHVCLISNRTVFGDVIYDLQPGYRQERIKILGYRTVQWDGSLNIPGFTYDNVVIKNWEPWQDYAIGDVVKYKEFYYSAKSRIPGELTFTSSNWNRLTEKPESGLYPNFEYKTNQFGDFYDLDSDNFDTEQQRLAQHLIGYQKRSYLENIINDEVSQYKFYQGYIQDKGTKGSLTKLFDVLSSADKDSLEFYEEWAVKDGQYGASDGIDEVEYKLDESKFRLSPQPIELVDSVTGEETDLVYRILPFETYVKSKDYNHAPFPSKKILDTYVKNAGYVNQQDVLGIATAYSDITAFPYNQIRKNSYIWVGNENRTWNVYKHVTAPYTIEAIESGDNEFTISLTKNPNDIKLGDVIGIGELYNYISSGPVSNFEIIDLEGFFEVKNVTNNKITLISDKPVESVDGIRGLITKFIKVRAKNAIDANIVLQKSIAKNDLIWIDDDGQGNWSVLKNNQSFTELQTIDNSLSGQDHNYATSLSVDERNTTLLVGSPDIDDGKVFVYNRPTNSVNFIQTQIIQPTKFGNDNERFGASVSISPDGEYAIIGSPNASNVRTKYAGDFIATNDYSKGSIVSKDQSLWQSLNDIGGELDNIEFNSFSSTTQAIESLGIETDSTLQSPVLLVGNYSIDPVTGQYAFPNTPVSHLLVRVTKDMYQGSGEGDQIKLGWNLRTYSNQNLSTLSERQPFNNDYSAISKETLEQPNSISIKVDQILYINGAINIPSVGDILQTATGLGTAAYVYADAAETVIYLKDVNGSFNIEDSLFRDDGDFIGQYVRQAPIDSINTSTVWGGYWLIEVDEYTPTTLTSISDEGKAIVVYDIDPDNSGTGRYYYNSLNLIADKVEGQNTIGSYIRTLSFAGSPGPNDINGNFLSDLYVIRAPKDVTDSIVAGDKIDIFVNQLPRYGDGVVVDLETIDLNKTITNKEQTVVDVWDGYINFDFTKFNFSGKPFEPKVGLTVRDKTRGGTAEVTFYQRNGLNVTIFVKNVTGSWSVGDDFGQNAEIEFIGVPEDPDTTYQVTRTIGQIQFTGLGFASANIGGLLVFDAGRNIEISTSDALVNAETWFYNSSTVQGISRPANVPSPSNNEWRQVYKISADLTGTPSNLTNEGLYSLYQKARSGIYDLVASFTVPERQSNFYLGNQVKITKFNNLYRGFIHAKGLETNASPGRIYLIKDGIENGISYNWEYAKNKKFKGPFNESLNYFTEDIVYRNTTPGKLYKAKTNIAPGLFDLTDWTLLDSVVDYVGYIPNNTDLSVITSEMDYNPTLDQTDLYSFGSVYDVSKNGDVLVVNALYDNTQPNKVIVYRSNNGQFEKRQEILAPDYDIKFGYSVSISDNGMSMAIGAPYSDDIQADQGVVFVYKQTNGEFQLLQTLNSPNNERVELFGWNVQFDDITLAVTARNADSFESTFFDNKETTFDRSFTEFKNINDDSGVVYLYEDYNGVLLYSQMLQSSNSKVNYFGRNLLIKNNHVYIGLPNLQQTNTQGQVVDYRKPDNSKIWQLYRNEKETIDLDKIKKVFLYDTEKRELVTYLDFIDPLQGKVAGIAEQELSFKTYYDPATYTTVNSNTSRTIVNDETNGWGPEHVGRLWWDLSTTKFINPYQSNVIYSTQNWNTVFQGNSIDVYEWVESDVLPSRWDQLADTNEGFPRGFSGNSLYGDSVYSIRNVFDGVAQTFKRKYYFWVKDKKITPDVEFRNINASDVANYIADPQGSGLRFVAFISPTQFVIHNCEDLIKGYDVALSVQFWTIENQTQNTHNQYQLIADGLETSLPKTDIIRKWFDSLIGYDEQKRIVPDTRLSPKYRYGTLFKPRQSWFVNRTEALKQFIERVNLVLSRNLIIDDKDISALFQNDTPPTEESRQFDTSVDTLDDLQFIGVARAQRAELSPVVENGKITRVLITNPGRGYRVAPTYEIFGSGEGAEFNIEINSQGQISSVTVLNSGNNYDSSTLISVRRFTVLVNSDNTILGKWALYERLQEPVGFWNRKQSQAFDVTLFWNYKDWYLGGYSDLTNIDFLVENAYQLPSLPSNIGDLVKISNVGSGGWLLLEKTNNLESADYTINYKTVGRQNGTIEFSSKLYNTQLSNVGFDTISYDTKLYDSEPVNELRIILNAIKNNLFIDDLQYEFNQLFFASLRYVFSEQKYVDWAYKTSFVKAKHNAGILREDITFNNDNLPSYEAYINEVKPFSTKIREYLSAYEGLDNTQSVVTDFELSPRYDLNQNRILPQSVKVLDNTLIGIDADIETYPNKHWLDNSGYKVIRVEVSDSGEGYLSPPELTVSGGGGSGVELKAFLGKNGSITSVDVVKQGTGYYSSPQVIINGNLRDGGKPAKLSAIIGDNPVRSIHTIVKFDRTTGTYVHTELSQTETFAGTARKFNFDLKWPMDLRKDTVMVIVDGVEMLTSEYSYSNILDNSKGYDRYFGRILFTEAPQIGDLITVSYKKSIDLLQAQDRINNFYNPEPGKIGKDLSQLMDGIDYGGVEVKGDMFGSIGGWDDNNWGEGTWDTTYDTTFEDEIFILDDDSTTVYTFKSPLENDVLYNIYKNGVRIDDPNFGNNELVLNPNALLPSILGNGQTGWARSDDDLVDNSGLYVFDEEQINFEPGDQLIFRKTTSEGTFNINPEGYDTILTGGNLNYSTATGLKAEDIVVDGDGFVTPTTSKGPEELIPGQILDTVDIKVYERPKGGASPIVSKVYRGDGVTKTFDISESPILNSNLFVKVNFEILTSSEYTVDYVNKTLTFSNAPSVNSVINIVILGVSGTNIVDIDQFIADGETVEFLTNVRFSNTLDYYVTIDGIKQENVIKESDETYEVPNNVILRFPSPPSLGQVIRFAFFEKEDTLAAQNFSEVLIDTFEADGSTTIFNLSQTPFTQEPAHWFTIVKVGNKILNAGYNTRFITTSSTLEYKLDEWQVPPGSISSRQMKVFLNNRELEYINEWIFVGTPSTVGQDGTLIRLNSGLQQKDGDVLDVYALNDGEYRFGYFNQSGDFIETPGTLYLDNAYNTGDVITVYQFSNHDSQGFERIKYDVVDRFNITASSLGETIPVEETVFRNDWYKIQHLRNGLIELREEAVDAQYVWVTLNGNLLTPSVNYFVTDNKRYVKILSEITENDTIEIIQFSNPITKNKFGWRQFKDVLNRTHYKRLGGAENILLAENLNWYDNEIVLINEQTLPSPVLNSRLPGVIFIEGERIEYFIKDGNKLKQIRRGTLGTGIKNVYQAGTEVYNQSVDTTVPYKDETLTTIFTGDGTTKIFELDFNPTDQAVFYQEKTGREVNPSVFFEVFVGGKRLRKNEVDSYIQPNPVEQDSPEGDEILPAEFTVNQNQLTLLNTPLLNEKIIIVRKQGKIWNPSGVALSDADTEIARFLRAKSTDLPR